MPHKDAERIKKDFLRKTRSQVSSASGGTVKSTRKPRATAAEIEFPSDPINPRTRKIKSQVRSASSGMRTVREAEDAALKRHVRLKGEEKSADREKMSREARARWLAEGGTQAALDRLDKAAAESKKKKKKK